MYYTLILCESEEEYTKELDMYLLNGHRFVAGSTVITSLENDVVLTTGQILHDTLPQFSIALRGEKDLVVFSKNIASFKEEVNSLLISKTHTPVIGSMSINSVHFNGYYPCERGITTYYSCCVKKE